MQLIQLFDCHRIGYIPLMFRFVMRVDEQRICHSILANSANQILVCFYQLNGGTGLRGLGDPLSTLVRPCQPTALLVLNRLQLVHSGVVSGTSHSLSLSLSTPSHSLSLSLLLSQLTFLQGLSKMTRNVARQDRFFPSGQNTTRFKLETLSLARNHTHLDGSPASLSKTHSNCNALTGVLTFGTGVLHLIQVNHQPDATIFQFIILTFVYSSICFGRSPLHHQELNDCSGSLWFYLRIVVIVVLPLQSLSS